MMVNAQWKKYIVIDLCMELARKQNINLGGGYYKMTYTAPKKKESVPVSWKKKVKTRLCKQESEKWYRRHQQGLMWEIK